MNRINFHYTSPTKGPIIEEFNFDDYTQTIRVEKTGRVKDYQHGDAITLAFYITELLRELGKRGISYTQFHKGNLRITNQTENSGENIDPLSHYWR